MTILVTGGAGYIGSHTTVELLNAGYDVVVLDNLSNSKEEALNRVKRITQKEFKFYKKDLNILKDVKEVFEKEKIDAVIHFAGLKAVGESVKLPLMYYKNNINGTLNLIQAMKDSNVKNIVFSSSATVYGVPKQVPIKEDFPLGATNPYGRTKLFIEQILGDVYNSDIEFNIVLLRYFNPIGAHKSGIIGEDPNGIPNNLMPYITQVAVGKLPELMVYGNDYDTPDGTGVRDYIHVTDLAIGHIKAIDKIKQNCGLKVYNLGTGRGYSVLEVINAFKEANGIDIPYRITERRSGDIATCYADPSLAEKELGWQAELGITEMCADSWNWQKNNPKGYN
jgi:UDP-glucose 4-epimerase